jgi:hypothetical protein
MANIYINKDAIYFTAPGAITSDYYKTTTQGYASSSFKTAWAGVNLGYTDGYILPTSGTLTFIATSKLDGTGLFSADNFSFNLSTLPVLWSADDLVFNKIASVQANNLIGSANNDIIPAYYPGDNIKGGLGKDTILLYGPSTAYSVTVTSASASNGKVTVLSNGNSFVFESMELITFSDKTVNVSDYVAYTPTQKTSTLSIIVDKGIIGVNAVLLSNLVETMTYSGSNLISHTVKYGNAVFNFNDIDPLVTTVVRDGSFTVEFQKEIANLSPSAANITYTDAVYLIGVANVENVLIHIAGADGNFVS